MNDFPNMYRKNIGTLCCKSFLKLRQASCRKKENYIPDTFGVLKKLGNELFARFIVHVV